MTIIEFLRSLSWEMNLYEVEIHWNWEYKCPVCGKYYHKEDNEFSCEGDSLADYREDSHIHLAGYPDVFKTKIEYCRIVIEENRISISRTEYADKHICEECESLEE